MFILYNVWVGIVVEFVVSLGVGVMWIDVYDVVIIWCGCYV